MIKVLKVLLHPGEVRFYDWKDKLSQSLVSKQECDSYSYRIKWCVCMGYRFL